MTETAQPAQDTPAAGTPPAYRFEDMRLKAGDRVQIQLPVNVTGERYIVRLIGYLDRQCVLVTAPAGLDRQRPLREGDEVVVRVFPGRGAFGFSSFVDKIIRAPFEYLHLSFPKSVQGLMVRKSPRVKTELAAKARTAAGEADVKVLNLSATGMLVRSTAALGEKGAEITVKLPLDVFDVKTAIDLRCRIRTLSTASDAHAGETHLCGVEFTGLQPDQMLILQSVVHHELARNPYAVV
ncbi:MAG TPA: flagellar brake protein [Burkholderiales bacterium]|nr:flagellar brake protein [Burkholderiales bacterium]